MAFSVFGYTKRQCLIYIVLALGNFNCGLSIAIQAPFYPSEAEKKGATATQYGFVFGVFELVVFIISPVCGKFMVEIGPYFLCTAGLFFSSGTCLLFGQLDKVNGVATFIGLSFAVRIMEALGNAAFMSSCYTIIAKEYPNNTGSIFSTSESFVGFGLMCGPTLGGLLYSVGGFSFPFTILGSFLLATTILAFFLLPVDTKEDVSFTHGNITALLKIKSILLMVFANAAAAYSIGCIEVSLEPHLRRFNLTSVQIGFMFIIDGVMYAMASPIWGILADKYIPPRVLVIIGGISMVIAFTLIGPAPYIPMEAPLWLIIIALIFHGIGYGCEFIGGYVASQREAILHGMPDDVNTYGIISGLWLSSFSFGAFVGPSLTGYLMDATGFRLATQVVVLLHVCVIISIAADEYYVRRKAAKNDNILLASEANTLYGSIDSHCM